MFSFVRKSNILNGTAQFWCSCQSIIVASISWVCHSNTQPKYWGQDIKQETILVLSFQVVPQFPPGLKFSSCPADLLPLWSALFWTGWECLWSASPSPSSWWVLSPGDSTGDTAGAGWTALGTCSPTSTFATEGPWFAQDTHSDWNICQSLKWEKKKKGKTERIPYQIQNTLGDTLVWPPRREARQN